MLGEEADDLTAAQVERNRAMEAASAVTGTSSGNGRHEKGTGGINLPGGRTLGAGGAKEKPIGIMVKAVCV